MEIAELIGFPSYTIRSDEGPTSIGVEEIVSWQKGSVSESYNTCQS